MSDNLTSPCCNTDYEKETVTSCCEVSFWGETDICSRCKEHAESEGYRCEDPVMIGLKILKKKDIIVDFVETN